MYRKERQEEILALIRKQGYVSVETLTERFHYSTATINRDLNELQKQNLIKRSYGGAEPVVPQGIPHVFRYQKMRKSKRKISARAAALVKRRSCLPWRSATPVRRSSASPPPPSPSA